MRIYLLSERLLLKDAKFEGTRCVGGWVINGAWYYRANDITGFAYYDHDSDLLRPVNEWPILDQSFVIVKELSNNYELVISKNKDKPVFTGTEGELKSLLVAAEKAKRRDERLARKYGLYDDDIPF